MTQDFNHTDWLLGQWARWSFIGAGGASGYPSATPFRRLLGSSVPSATITDEEAQHIDRIMAQLKQRHPDTAKALKTYYRNGCNASKAADKLGINRRKLDLLTKQGIMWIDAALLYCETQTY